MIVNFFRALESYESHLLEHCKQFVHFTQKCRPILIYNS